MRRLYGILLFLGPSVMAVGCRSGTPAPPPPAPVPIAAAAPARTAAALAFTPPVAYANPPLQLDRDERVQGAFVGYESTEVSYYFVRQDDRFRFGTGNGWEVPSYFERRAVSTTIGMRTR